MICPFTLLVIERQRFADSIQSGCQLSCILQVQRVWVAQIVLPLIGTQLWVTNVLDTCVELTKRWKKKTRTVDACQFGQKSLASIYGHSFRRNASDQLKCEWTETRKLNDSLRADRLCHAASIHFTKSARQTDAKLVLTTASMQSCSRVIHWFVRSSIHSFTPSICRTVLRETCKRLVHLEAFVSPRSGIIPDYPSQTGDRA